MATTRRFRITVNGTVFQVEAEELEVVADSTLKAPPVGTAPIPAAQATEARASTPPQAGTTMVDAPLPGLILDVKVAVGDRVTTGQVLVILEAMKMENEIVASTDGMVESVRVTKGDSVSSGDILAVIK